jgi:hypothetical protein
VRIDLEICKKTRKACWVENGLITRYHGEQ